jgi:hypothetical protein
MQKLFWAIVAVDAALFLFLLIATLAQRSPADGGREMALFFGVLLPGAAVALAVVLYVLSSSRAWRVVAMLIVAAPLLFIAAVHARSAYIDYAVRQDSLRRSASSERKP